MHRGWCACKYRLPRLRVRRDDRQALDDHRCQNAFWRRTPRGNLVLRLPTPRLLPRVCLGGPASGDCAAQGRALSAAKRRPRNIARTRQEEGPDHCCAWAAQERRCHRGCTVHHWWRGGHGVTRRVTSGSGGCAAQLDSEDPSRGTAGRHTRTAEKWCAAANGDSVGHLPPNTHLTVTHQRSPFFAIVSFFSSGGGKQACGNL